MRTDYTSVTELPGTGATVEQLAMLYTRYHVASQFCREKDALELGCGAGQGLGYLAKTARTVVGAEYTEHLARIAHLHCQERAALLQLDGHALPFRDSCFDVAILFEVIYYLARPARVLGECRRVLRKDGVLLVCTANKDWYGFNRSPFSVGYFSAHELYELLDGQQFKAELFGAFPATAKTAKDRVIAALRKTAIALHLIPMTMKRKAFLKRLLYGRLSVLPAEICDEIAVSYPLVPIAVDRPNSHYKVLYAIARTR